ncbi:MAG: hypothetical protein WCI87_09575 [Euryarchaeota archaeon]
MIDIFREKMGERVQPGLIIAGCKEVYRVGERGVAVPCDLVCAVDTEMTAVPLFINRI